jgi:hypothetical protein
MIAMLASFLAFTIIRGITGSISSINCLRMLRSRFPRFMFPLNVLRAPKTRFEAIFDWRMVFDGEAVACDAPDFVCDALDAVFV